MRHALQARQAEKAAGALDRVDHAEDQRQGRRVVWCPLQRDQSEVEFRQILIGFGQEVGEQIVHGALCAARAGRVRGHPEPKVTNKR